MANDLELKHKAIITGGIGGSIAAGAAIGSIVPGAGTIVGAAVGAILGGTGTLVAVGIKKKKDNK